MRLKSSNVIRSVASAVPFDPCFSLDVRNGIVGRDHPFFYGVWWRAGTRAVFQFLYVPRRFGCGGVVAEFLSSHLNHPRHLRLGTDDEFMHEVGDQIYAQKKYGLDSSGIASHIKIFLNKNEDWN